MDFTQVEPYRPEDNVKDYTTKRYSDFQYCLSLRDQTYHEFDDLTPDDYWAEARKRVKNYLPPLSASQELSNMFLGKTRNKRNVIAAFVSAQRPRVEISVRAKGETKKTDKRLSQMLRTAYDFFMDKEDADEKYLDWTIEALDVGTAFLLEDYAYFKQQVKIVEEEDHATGEKKWIKQDRIVKDECQASIVPIEDLFVPNFYEPDIQEQPYIILREYIPRLIAHQRYGYYANWKYVPIAAPRKDEKESDSFFFQLLEDRIEDNFVEVLHYMNRWDDEHAIFCNGVLMTQMDNPIRYDHKKIPIAKTINEKMGPRFFYGMAMPMKVVSEQDGFNELANNNMDRSRISSIPKFISNYETELEVDNTSTYSIIKGDGDSGLRELDVQSVKPGDMNFLQFLGTMIDEATVDASFSGSIEGVTAAEIMNAKAQNQQKLGAFLTYIYAAAKRHAELRMATILQYFFMTSKKWDGKVFDTREISRREKLQDGTDGTRIIRVVSSDKKIPPKEDRIKEKQRGVLEKKDALGRIVDTKVEVNYDYIYVTPQEIADIDYTINVVPGSSLPETQSLKKALALEFSSAMSQPQFAGNTDFGKVQKIIIESFGYLPEDVQPDQDAQEQMGTQQMMEQQQGAGMLQEGQGGATGEQNSKLVQQMAQTKAPDLQQLLSGA